MASDQLWDELCCCGDDHTVRQGGSHINIVQLKKLAKWSYLISINLLVPKSQDYPLANAVVCDRCLKEGREIIYAVGGRDGSDGHTEYFRVPIDELDAPEFYWPDHHPGDCPQCQRLALIQNAATSDLERDLAKTNLILHLEKDHKFSSLKILEMTGVYHG